MDNMQFTRKVIPPIGAQVEYIEPVCQMSREKPRALWHRVFLPEGLSGDGQAMWNAEIAKFGNVAVMFPSVYEKFNKILIFPGPVEKAPERLQMYLNYKEKLKIPRKQPEAIKKEIKIERDNEFDAK